MIDTLLPVLPVLLLFLVGFSLQKISFFSSSSIADMKKLVSNLALPALMIQAFSSIEIEAKYLLLVILIFLTCGLMVILGKILAKPFKVKSPYFAFMMGGFEMGMFGYALFLGLYGQQHIGKLALVDLGQVLFVFFILMALLIKERGDVSHPSALLKQFITSPVILAIFSGLIISLLKPHVHPTPLLASLGEFIDMLSRLTVPLIAITIGYGIHFQKEGLKDSLKTILVRKGLAIVLLLLLNELVVVRWLGMHPMYRYGMMVMFLTPPPYVISIFMKQDDKRNMDYVANTLSLDTVISVLLIIVFASFY
ncbi:MAG: AEC family transporter [Sphaerochaetaceae bacterium]|nr:AEC family transporter [Sphaerochaetaceae bacterium]